MLHWLHKNPLSKRTILVLQLALAVLVFHAAIVLIGCIGSWVRTNKHHFAIKAISMRACRPVTVVKATDLPRARTVATVQPSSIAESALPVTQGQAPAIAQKPQQVAAIAVPTSKSTTSKIPALDRSAHGTKKSKTAQSVTTKQEELKVKPVVNVAAFGVREVVVRHASTNHEAFESVPVQSLLKKNHVESGPLRALIDSVLAHTQQAQSEVSAVAQDVAGFEYEVIGLEREREFIHGIHRSWHPPLGVRVPEPCIIEFTVSERGRAHRVRVVKTSQVASYDAAACLAVKEYAYPNWLWTNTMQLTFGE